MSRGWIFLTGMIVLLLGFFLFILLVYLESDLGSIQKQLTLPISQLLDAYRVMLVLLAMALIFCGLAVVITASLSEDKPNGLPLTDITQGPYKIAFMKVFQAGDPNASAHMVIEKSNLNSMGLGSVFLFFKFPIQAFEGEIIDNANKLVVTVSGGKEQFKKLRLKKE